MIKEVEQAVAFLESLPLEELSDAQEAKQVANLLQKLGRRGFEVTSKSRCRCDWEDYVRQIRRADEQQLERPTPPTCPLPKNLRIVSHVPELVSREVQPDECDEDPKQQREPFTARFYAHAFDRLVTVIDEAFGIQPVAESADELVGMLEKLLEERRQRVSGIESELERLQREAQECDAESRKVQAMVEEMKELHAQEIQQVMDNAVPADTVEEERAAARAMVRAGIELMVLYLGGAPIAADGRATDLNDAIHEWISTQDESPELTKLVEYIERKRLKRHTKEGDGEQLHSKFKIGQSVNVVARNRSGVVVGEVAALNTQSWRLLVRLDAMGPLKSEQIEVDPEGLRPWLMTTDELASLVGAQTPQAWRAAVSAVVQARGGSYPPDWTRRIPLFVAKRWLEAPSK